ncbi:MAG: acyloxyacyl hydrolase [Bacteroidetes bacterium]|nr:acyloxyacyl hydrolase [Bacteroidota bacterium]
MSENYGQEALPKFYFGGINFNTGKFLPHSKRIDKIKSNVFAVQAKIYQNIKYNNDWKNPFNSTKFGYSLTYIHATNAVIGDLWGANMFMEPSLFSYHRLHIYTHMGAGIAYATNKFNKETNPTDFMISTDLSFFFNLKLNLDFELSKQFSLGLNAGFSHCSNAALNLPNLGINIFNYGFNLGYNIYDNQKPINSCKLTPEDKKWAYDFAVGVATRGVNEYIDKYYFIVNSDFSINRFLSRKNIMSLNFHYVLRQGDIYDNYYDTKYYNYFGLALGHELLIRNLSVLTQLGAYLYDTHLNQHYWYAHLGIRYYFTKNIFGMITLSNRKQSADYLQYAVGYRFK